MVETRNEETLIQVLFEFVKVFFFVYLFLVSIDLMGIAFKSSGEGLKSLMQATTNPFIGLAVGIVTTSLIQSSSTTTSIIVALVGSGALPLQSAIPMVMGANIGTTVTCTIVSFGYVGRKAEFERSFGASIVHDIFNVSATLILFPLELYTHVIYKTSIILVEVFEKFGGFEFTSPFKLLIRPVTDPISGAIENHFILLAVALVLLFFSISKIVSNMKGIVMEKIEQVLNRYLFRNVLISLFFGMFFTALVQSSSITTSILVPLVGAGLLSLEQVFPYMLGANVGTTITAVLAALSFGTGPAMTIATCHFVFNVMGISLIYPVRKVPIYIARSIASFAAQSKKNFLIFLFFYILLHLVPIVFAKFI
jgi:solute carrier family 34 (sodium-dependent phosphate cotransporter)